MTDIQHPTPAELEVLDRLTKLVNTPHEDRDHLLFVPDGNGGYDGWWKPWRQELSSLELFADVHDRLTQYVNPTDTTLYQAALIDLLDYFVAFAAIAWNDTTYRTTLKGRP